MQTILLFCELYFTFLMVSFENFSFWWCSIYFLFVSMGFVAISNKPLHHTRLWIVMLILKTLSFISYLGLWSILNSFWYVVWGRGPLNSFAYGCAIVPLLKIPFFLCWTILVSLLKSFDCKWGFILRLSILFHSSIWLKLYHTILIAAPL